MGKRLVLASASPRRSEIMTVAGYRFDVIPSRASEISEGMSPAEIAKVNAFNKAKDTFLGVGGDIVVVGADTVVAVDGKILGKPKDDEDAFQMLKSLSGRIHHVITGYAVVSGNFEESGYCVTEVTFRNISADEICAYIATNEHIDKAGAYAIQEKGSLFVKAIKGDFFNVVGLPVSELSEILQKVGVYPDWQK